MYKIFHGFHLVEAYQDLKKAKRLAKNRDVGIRSYPRMDNLRIDCCITITYRFWQ